MPDAPIALPPGTHCRDGYVCKAQVMRDCVFVWEPD